MRELARISAALQNSYHTHLTKLSNSHIKMMSTRIRNADNLLRGVDLVSDRKVVCEFKEARAMSSGRLKKLDGAVIEVDLGLERGQPPITGKGIYVESDPDLGPSLRILVSDPNGNFELCFSESNWSGFLEESKLTGCDYRISFTNDSACS